MHNFTNVISKTLLLSWHPSLNWPERQRFFLDRGMLEGLGVDQIEVYSSTNIHVAKLANGVSCSYICIFISCGSYVVS
jgi:hypothetical protein